VLESEHLRPGDERVRAAANRHRGPEVLVVDFRVPMRDRDAGSLRMFEMIGSLLRLGYGVKFLPDNLVPIQPYTRDLQRLGIEVMYGSLNLNHEFAEIGPGLQAAILSRPHSASRWLDSVCEFAPSATVIYDTVDLHWIRESRRFALGKGDTAERDGAIAVQGPKAAALRELELALVRASDITITVTADERKVLEAQVPEANVAVIPTIHNIAPRVTPVDQRRGLLFVGGFEHPPNADAVVYLIREVMPLVWNLLGDVSVTIIGSSVPPEVEKLASSRVDVRGWVEDLEPLLQSARALVAPVRFGAGVKGKITQGLAAGLPVVTTPVGAEGLGGSDGENMLIGGDTDALAERIVRVVEDDVLWGSLSRGGQELIAGGFSLDVLDERMRELLDHRVLGHPIASGG
jgi:O-antigen biosynthesis protein